MPTTATSGGGVLAPRILNSQSSPKVRSKVVPTGVKIKSEAAGRRDQPSGKASPKLLPLVATKLNPDAHTLLVSHRTVTHGASRLHAREEWAFTKVEYIALIVRSGCIL